MTENTALAIAEAEETGFRLRAKALRIQALAAELREVADEHHAFEQTLTEPDADWPTWYAARLVERGWR
jgi:hypothetical protein